MYDPYVLIPDVYEDRHTRDPEFGELPSGPGNQAHRIRTIEWSHITDEVKVSGPTIAIDPPLKPR